MDASCNRHYYGHNTALFRGQEVVGAGGGTYECRDKDEAWLLMCTSARCMGIIPFFPGQNPLYPGQAVGGAAGGRHDNKDNLNLRF